MAVFKHSASIGAFPESEDRLSPSSHCKNLQDMLCFMTGLVAVSSTRSSDC